MPASSGSQLLIFGMVLPVRADSTCRVRTTLLAEVLAAVAVAWPGISGGRCRGSECYGRRHRERLEREHRRRDLIGGRIRDRRRGAFEHEEPPTGDLARERLAAAHTKEPVP